MEPDRYFANVTATLETQPPQSLSFSIARLGGDRRWTFELPQGPAVYLEKSGLKYVVFPTRGQYAEVLPGDAGFKPSELLTLNAAWPRLKSQPSEQLGVEPVNGRTAVKYRYAPAAGSDRSEFLSVDQESGLLIRSELSAVRSKEQAGGGRLIVDARDLHFNPDSLQFDVPSGMKKVPADRLKSDIASLSEAVRPYSVFF